jgi:hypothetical protein
MADTLALGASASACEFDSRSAHSVVVVEWYTRSAENAGPKGRAGSIPVDDTINEPGRGVNLTSLSGTCTFLIGIRV